MGLDMYLYKKTYVKNWSHMSPEELHEITITKNGQPTNIKSERISHIVEEVGYWRKFNALHQWFVNNVQKGIDNCQESYVDPEKLKKLLDTLKTISADRNLAPELLPTQGGFFFGNENYDEWYWNDVKKTIKMLTDLLGEGGSGDFYYRASW